MIGLDAVAPGVVRLGIVMVNAYLAGAPGEPWVLVDTGLPGSAWRVRQAVERRYGRERPVGILLTHGHFDHAGSALQLARYWDVPIYAHPLELPYLTGRSDYPPPDPSMGGAFAQMARVFPHSGYQFGDRVRALPDDGTVPGLPGWQWLHTPGHTAGHVSYFREADRLLLAGDAFCTMDTDSWTEQVVRKPELCRPPAPFTPDWGAAQESIRRLADLEPRLIAAGHGHPIVEDAAARLGDFAEAFTPPAYGRYVSEPARMDERGVVTVPPPVPDPVAKRAKRVALAAAALFLLRKLR